MSPRLKPLLLPQLVEEERTLAGDKLDDKLPSQHHITVLPEQDHSHVYYTMNSSSSDIGSPLTPTFSTRGHLRGSSSSSSLELAGQLQDNSFVPSSPTQPPSAKLAPRHLPDVQEHPMEQYGEEEQEEELNDDDNFGLDRYLSNQQPANELEWGTSSTHQLSTPCVEVQEQVVTVDDMFAGELVTDCDLDYDAGFFSDGEVASDSRSRRRRQNGSDSPLTGLTRRLSSRLPAVSRWRPTKKTNWISSPTTETSFESVLSRAPSSRSSSMSASLQRLPDQQAFEPKMNSTCSIPFVASNESIDIIHEDRASLEKDRAMATTPLLPPLLTNSIPKNAKDSPLQSPSVAPLSPATEVPISPLPSSAMAPRPSLSTKPSFSSFRPGINSPELPLPLPPLLQEHDEWSDRLGHANFTITPQPYEPENINPDSIAQFHRDWDTAKVNYTRHLVRTGENYPQTSKIYGLTEAKWAETDKQWRTTYEKMVRQTMSTSDWAAASAAPSRSRSRPRGRGRSGSASASIIGRRPTDDGFAAMEWSRLEDTLPGAIPRMLDANKFPDRGDEDIVGPMQRDEVMVRAQSEERKGSRFWKNLADKVGIRV